MEMVVDVTTTARPAIPLAVVAMVLGEPKRWSILRELAKGEALPVSELARRAGTNADSASKHMRCLRKAGIVRTGYGRLYSLAPAFHPAPGSREIDFGHCVVRPDE